MVLAISGLLGPQGMVRQFWPLGPLIFPVLSLKLLAGIKPTILPKQPYHEPQTQLVCLVLGRGGDQGQMHPLHLYLHYLVSTLSFNLLSLSTMSPVLRLLTQ